MFVSVAAFFVLASISISRVFVSVFVLFIFKQTYGRGGAAAVVCVSLFILEFPRLKVVFFLVFCFLCCYFHLAFAILQMSSVFCMRALSILTLSLEKFQSS